jgi:hypothetical protein
MREARSEQQAVQDLDPEGAGGRTPTPTEDTTKLGEEQPPSGEGPTGPGAS